MNSVNSMCYTFSEKSTVADIWKFFLIEFKKFTFTVPWTQSSEKPAFINLSEEDVQVAVFLLK